MQNDYAEAPVTGRDWTRIETELDELLPGVAEADDRPVPDPRLQPAGRRGDEDSILKHIADALGLDKA
jgi:hypothetical protein